MNRLEKVQPSPSINEISITAIEPHLGDRSVELEKPPAKRVKEDPNAYLYKEILDAMAQSDYVDLFFSRSCGNFRRTCHYFFDTFVNIVTRVKLQWYVLNGRYSLGYKSRFGCADLSGYPNLKVVRYIQYKEGNHITLPKREPADISLHVANCLADTPFVYKTQGRSNIELEMINSEFCNMVDCLTSHLYMCRSYSGECDKWDYSLADLYSSLGHFLRPPTYYPSYGFAMIDNKESVVSMFIGCIADIRFVNQLKHFPNLKRLEIEYFTNKHDLTVLEGLQELKVHGGCYYFGCLTVATNVKLELSNSIQAEAAEIDSKPAVQLRSTR